MDDRARLEQDQFAFFIRRHLAERLEAAIGLGLLVLRADHVLGVRQARLFERPAHAKVADQALGERRHGTEDADADCGHFYIPRDGNLYTHDDPVPGYSTNRRLSDSFVTVLRLTG